MGLELRYGKLKYISFIVLDLICLYLANLAAFGIYVEQTHVPYDPSDHLPVLVIMLVIDVAVTLVFMLTSFHSCSTTLAAGFLIPSVNALINFCFKNSG